MDLPEPPRPDQGEQPTARSMRWWVVLAAVVIVGALVVFVVLLTAKDRVVRPTATDRGGAAYHQAHLADYETESLAGLLVDVPGYGYRDAGDVEIEAIGAQMNAEAALGLSLHSVLDAEGSEVAFLQMYEFVPDKAPDVLTVEDAKYLTGGKGADVSVAGHHAVLTEDTNSPSSRYFYVWIIGDVVFVADGPDKERLTSWLQAYLPVVDGSIPG